MRYFNRVRVSTATEGTGTITYGSAVSDGFLTPEEAGAVSSDRPIYVIEEGNDFEMSWGVIDVDANTLTRNVITSKIAGVQGTSKMNLGGNAQIRFIADAGAVSGGLEVKSGASPAEYSAGFMDRGKTFVFTDEDGATLDLTAAATLGNDWSLTVMARGGAATIDPNGAELIEGESSYDVADGSDAVIRCDGTGFYVQAGGGGAPSNAENLIINGDFRIAQRGTSFSAGSNNDAAYTLDRWLLLSDGNDILDVSQEGSVIPAGARNALLLDVETANKRAGVCQIVEADNAKITIGAVASLSFKARKGAGNATVDTLRVLIAAWSGTPDDVTSDVVDTWGTEGNDPTLAESWTIEASETFLLTDEYQTFKLENVAIDTASAANIAVLLMLENDDATVGDLVYIGDVHLCCGPSAVAVFTPRAHALELTMCRRFYTRIVADHGGNVFLTNAQCFSSDAAGGPLFFEIPMRAVPEISASDASDLKCTTANGTARSASSLLFNNISPYGTTVALVDVEMEELAAGNATNILISSGGWIAADAEL